MKILCTLLGLWCAAPVQPVQQPVGPELDTAIIFTPPCKTDSDDTAALNYYIDAIRTLSQVLPPDAKITLDMSRSGNCGVPGGPLDFTGIPRAHVRGPGYLWADKPVKSDK